MSGLETITLSRGEFGRLAAQQAKAMTAEMEAEAPRARELGNQISALAAEAESKNIKVDDETVAENPAAADLRRRLDKVVPEFQELANRQQARIIRSRRATETLQKAIQENADITLSAADALDFLGLTPDKFSL